MLSLTLSRAHTHSLAKLKLLRQRSLGVSTAAKNPRPYLSHFDEDISQKFNKYKRKVFPPFYDYSPNRGTNTFWRRQYFVHIYVPS